MARTKQELVYQSLQRQIEQGLLIAGEKLPSVREFAKQQGFGIQTILHAYEKLQDDGWIEGRERSGFFVKSLRPTKTIKSPTPDIKLIEKPDEDEIIEQIFKHVYDSRFINFGALVPDKTLFNKSEMARIGRHHIEKILSYGNHRSDEKLRDLVLSQNVIRFAESKSITLTHGTINAVFIALSCICKPGDIVAIESPFYYSFRKLFSVLKLRPLEIPTDHQDGLSPKKIASAFNKHRFKALICSSSFSNPSGVTNSDANKTAIVECAQKKGFFIIEDDVYGHLFFGSKREKRYSDFDSRGVCFYCASLTKSFICGIKVGWLISPKRFELQIRDIQMASTGFLSPFEQAVAYDILKSRKALAQVKRIKHIYAENILRIRNILQNESDGTLESSSPKGGYFLWIKGSEHLDAKELFQVLLKKRILISPGQIFSYTGNYNRFFRINCGYQLTEQRIDALRQIAKVARTSGE